MKPRRLKPGDTVSLVSPASSVTPEKLGPITQLLEAEGYKVIVGPHALDADGFLAGSDRDRANDVQQAFRNPDVDAVICTRGGYGSARLMPYLDLDQMAESQKLFVGFSDITTLHLALNRRGFPTLYAPMALSLFYPREPWVIEAYRRALKGDLTMPVEAPRPITVVSGVSEGESVGGCLCLLTDSIGTPEALNTEGKVLFIEDVGEMPHRVDAMLTHLLNSGMIQKAAGIVIGEMTQTDDKADEEIGIRLWRDIVAERLGSLGIPMIVDYPFGHKKIMLPVGLGVKVRLDAGAGTVTYLESLCE